MKLSRTAFFTVAALAITVAITLYLILIRCMVDSGWSKTGVFGDSFGGLNALFSALAFVAVIYSLRQQSEMIEKQEIEIADNKKALEEQKTSVDRQRRESTLLKMIGYHLDIVRQTEIHDGTGQHSIASALLFVYGKFRGTTPLANMKEISKVDAIEIFAQQKREIRYFIINYETYLQSFLALHKLVVDSQLKNDAPQRYFDLIMSYTSKPEQELLFLHIYLYDNDRELADIDRDFNLTNRMKEYIPKKRNIRFID
jgi:hypothetical protein